MGKLGGVSSNRADDIFSRSLVRVSEVTMIGTVGGVACSAAAHVSIAVSLKAPTLNDRPSRGRDMFLRTGTLGQPAPVMRPETSCTPRTHAFASCLKVATDCFATSSANHSEPTWPLLTTSRSTYAGRTSAVRSKAVRVTISRSVGDVINLHPTVLYVLCAVF